MLTNYAFDELEVCTMKTVLDLWRAYVLGCVSESSWEGDEVDRQTVWQKDWDGRTD